MFTESKVDIQTKYTSFLKFNTVIAFNNRHVWLGFSCGNWVLYDWTNGKIANEGCLEGKREDFVHLFYSPKLLDDKTIVFINVPKLKFTTINPFDKKVELWYVNVPTTQTLPENERNNAPKAQDILDDLDMAVLTETKIVCTMERRD